MLNNQYHGITVEDLEKAASVRLFEKAAAAEGINLNELSEAQVDELYSNYQQSSEENTMNEEIFDLFEKQAAYEGVDLEALSDDELAYVFNNFVGNLESELEDDVDYDEDDYDYDEEEEAYEKLAEAEILGRHMARAYMDELEKEASVKEKAKAAGEKAKETGGRAARAVGDFTGISDIAEGLKQRKASKSYASRAEEMREKIKAGGQSKAMKRKQGETAAKRSRKGSAAAEASSKALRSGGKKLLRTGGIVGATGLALKGAHSMMDKEAMFNGILEERAQEFIDFGKEAGYDGSYMDDIALEVLRDLGYDLSPLY